MRLSKRQFLGGIAATTILAAPSIVRAQSREMQVVGPSSITTPIRNFLISKFEKKFNCTVLYEGSHSLANIQKLRESKDKPIISVVMMDDPVMILAHQEGLLEPITPAMVPNLTKILPKAVQAEGAWINYQRPPASIGYNTNLLPKGIDSWATLWEPRFKQRVAIPSLELTQGIWALIAAAQVATKLPMEQAMRNIEAGFDQLALLKPNLLTIYTQTAQGIQLLEQGEISLIGGDNAHGILTRRDAGAPIEIGKPKEGSFIAPNGMALIKNAPNRELACSYINEFLSDDFQYIIADKLHAEPVVPTAPVPPGFQRTPNLHAPDWFYIAKNRTAWIDRWARIFSKA